MAPTAYPYKSQWQPNRKDYAVKAKAFKVARGRKTNKKVLSKLRKGPVKTIVKGNKSAIYQLSKQVKLLQLQKFGSIQRQMQHVRIAPGAGNTPLIQAPVFFCFNQFKDTTPYFNGVVSAAGQASAVQGLIGFRKQTFDIDLEDKYQWNELANSTTTVSIVEYLPVFCNLKIQISGSRIQTDDLLRYRFTLFKTKRLPPNNNQKLMSLPLYGGAYWHMCDDDASTRNYFSKSYHTVLIDKWLTIPPPEPYTSVKKINQVINIPYSFGKIESVKVNQAPVPVGQTVYTNIPEKDQMWLMISCNLDGTAAAPLDITFDISRHLTWRDRHNVMS